MSKKRTPNRSLIGAGKPFKAVKDDKGNIKWADSITQQGTSKTTVSKKSPQKNVVAKMSFKSSGKLQTPMQQTKANVKTTVRFKGLEKMKSKIAESTPTKSQPTKAKSIKRKPPTKAR